MFGWFTRKPNRPANPATQLRVESLENRYCPTGVMSETALSAPPTLTCALTYLDHRMVRIQGEVTDDNLTNAVVHFSGVATGTVAVQADGSFTYDLNASGLGDVTAVATDADNNSSNSQIFTLQSNAPAIVNFTAVNEGANYWVFTGRVLDESAAGLTISFGGIAALNNQTVQVDSNGYFRLAVTLPAYPMGTVSATTTDWWGLESNEAQFLLG